MATKTPTKKTVKKKTAKKKSAPAKKATPKKKSRSRVQTMDEAGIDNGNGRHLQDAVQDGAQVQHDGPYTVAIEVEGIAPLLIHGYNVDLIEALDKLQKGAKEKKRDYPEHVCFWDRPFITDRKKDAFPGFKRDPKALLCGSTDWIYRAMVECGRLYKDSSSSGGRKMAKELVEAGLLVTGEKGQAEVTPFYVSDSGAAKRDNYRTTTTWDYLDKRRVVVNNSAVPRVRPAMNPGWRLRYLVTVQTPQYIPLNGSGLSLRTLIDQAGLLKGLADFRPKFGRFRVTNFDLLEE